MARFVRVGKNGKQIEIACERVEGKKEWKIRLFLDGKTDYMSYQESSDPLNDLTPMVMADTPDRAKTLVIGLKGINLSNQTANAYIEWLKEAVESSKTDAEKTEEAEASRQKEIQEVEGLLARAETQQPRTPKTKKEAEALTKDLREFQREEYGVWGSWARIISEEEVEELRARLAELKAV